MYTNTIRRTVASLATLGFMACGGDKAEDGREIELAPADSSSAMNDNAPAAAPAPATSSPNTPRPTPRPTSTAPASGSRTGSLASGATIALASGARICTNTHKVGDRFTAITTRDLFATNSVTIPTGSEVTLEVVESARGQNSRDRVRLAFRPVSITVRGTTTAISASVTQVAALDVDRVQSTGTQVEKVAVGAAAGAIAGQVLGRNTKSTVAGAAVGAAAGGAVAAATTDYDGCLAANAPLTVTLSSGLTVRGS